MNNEFKKIDQGDVTRYVLESASGGGTSAGNVASVSKAMGGVQRRSNLLVQDVSPKLTPRSPVAHAAQKVAKGSGKHTDRKQQSKQVRGEKHKTKDFAENQDHEISMAGSEIHSIFQNAKQLHTMIKTKSEEEGLDAWQQSKITKAADYLNSVLQSLQHEIMGEGDRTMSRAAKGNEKYGKDGMRALAKAGRDGASEKQLDAIRDKHDHYNEDWSQKYKNSINCSHPKGFSQKAHCAGKRKHNESIAMEMTCPDCGMCKTHGNNMMEVKQRLDAKCWKGKHKEGTKIKGGVRVNNCVPNEGLSEFKMALPPTGMSPEEAQKFAADQQAQSQSMYQQQQSQQSAQSLPPGAIPGRNSPHPKQYKYDEKLDAWIPGTPLAPANEDSYMESLSAALEQKLSVNDTPEEWRDDFEHADPVKYKQFRNKTVEKKHHMADVARYRQIQKK
jgi:hypothetical protein